MLMAGANVPARMAGSVTASVAGVAAGGSGVTDTAAGWSATGAAVDSVGAASGGASLPPARPLDAYPQGLEVPFWNPPGAGRWISKPEETS